MSARFVFAVSQIGAERALKHEVGRAIRTCGSRSRGRGSSRFAWPTDGGRTGGRELELSRGVRAHLGLLDRQGHRHRSDAIALAFWRRVSRHYGARPLGTPFRQLHVWRRDRELPGDEGFEPRARAEIARTHRRSAVEAARERAHRST